MQRQRLTELFNAHTRQKRRTLLSVGHGISCVLRITRRNAVKQNHLSFFIFSHGDHFSAFIHGREKIFLVLDGQLVSVQNLCLSLRAVEGQIDEPLCFRPGFQSLSLGPAQRVLPLRIRGLDNTFHLPETQIDQGLKMLLNLGAHAHHIGIDHLIERIRILLYHKSIDQREHTDTENQQAGKAYPEKPDDLFV